MSTNPTAEWWIRTDGAAANGGGYDAGIASAGTNYCDQAAAQAVWTLLTLTITSNVLTDTSSLGLFTMAMIGSAVNVPGQGYYWIVSVTNSNVVVVALGSGAATSFVTQPGKLGGALAKIENLSTTGGSVSSPGTVSGLAAGNTVNIRANGGTVASPDYTQTGYAEFPNGNTTGGYVTFVGYNGKPVIKGNGLMIYNTTYLKLQNLYLTTSGTGTGTFGIVAGNCTNAGLYNCTIDVNNQAMGGLGGTSGGGVNFTVIDCEIVGSGTTSTTGVTTSSGCYLKNCKIHGWGTWGVVEGGGTTGSKYVNCAVYSNGGGAGGGGIDCSTAPTSVANVIDGCTIDANTGDGIKVVSTASATLFSAFNNNITNNSGNGFNFAAGTAATNTQAVAFCDYNNVYGNGTNYTGINAGAHDISQAPGYSSGGPYTPTNTALVAAVPIGFSTAGSGLYIGAVQPPSSGGGGPVSTNFCGGFQNG